MNIVSLRIEPKRILSLAISERTGAGDRAIYDGPYSVDPWFTEQTLETSGRAMTDNVKILAIPVVYEENGAGGYTVTIG